MDRIALTGGMYSGKSSIAAELEKRGYMRVIFTDLLKELAASALTGIGVGTTKEDILGNKKKYRPFLQSMGDVIGFGDDPYYVRRALFGWIDAKPPVVFDCVRTREQFNVLRMWGFTLVRVEVPLITQSDRAAAAGVPLEEFLKVRAHPSEQGIGLTPDLVVDGTKEPETNARFLIREKEYTLQETRN